MNDFVALLRAALRRAEESLLRISYGAGAIVFIPKKKTNRNIILKELLLSKLNKTNTNV
jgi:hypothetical protein